MKEQILKVIETALTKDYFLELEVELTVNGEKVHGGNYGNPLFLKDIDISDIDNVLTSIGEIDGYNLTLKRQYGVNLNHEDESKIFANNWKDNIFTFWSGNDPGDKPIDTLKYGKFEWHGGGARCVFDSNGIRSKLNRPDFESDERWATVDGNYFEYEKVGEIMDLLQEFDILLDRQHEERILLYNKLKLEL